MAIQSSFSLIQQYIITLVQFAQFDKNNHVCQCMKLVIIWGTNGTENSGKYQTCNPHAWVRSQTKFCSVFDILDLFKQFDKFIKS